MVTKIDWCSTKCIFDEVKLRLVTVFVMRLVLINYYSVVTSYQLGIYGEYLDKTTDKIIEL